MCFKPINYYISQTFIERVTRLLSVLDIFLKNLILTKKIHYVVFLIQPSILLHYCSFLNVTKVNL